MTIRAIIWDLGGVLVRTDDPAPRTALAARHGMPRAALEALVFNSDSGMRAQLGEISASEHWRHVAQSLGVTPAEIPDLQDDFWGGDRLDTELVDFIRELRGPYTTVLLSNAFSDLRRYVEGHWKIADAFDHLLISAEVGLVKPDPRIYRLALERAGDLPAERAVFLDDFVENVEGARAVGLLGVHFRNPAQGMDDLRSLWA